MTLCNMVVEARGKNGVVPPDSTTYKYLEVRAIDHYIPHIDIQNFLRSFDKIKFEGNGLEAWVTIYLNGGENTYCFKSCAFAKQKVFFLHVFYFYNV